MREPILKAVAMPPRIFWAPAVPAIINVAVQLSIMFLWITSDLGSGGSNPLFFIATIVFVHIFIIIYGVKEPHLSNMMRAWGPLASPSRNVYKGKGNKLAP